jgi:hypothetical protein
VISAIPMIPTGLVSVSLMDPFRATASPAAHSIAA